MTTQAAATAGTAVYSPLSGMRVLDLTRVVSGPFGTLLLSDLGAEVIRVEAVPSTRSDAKTTPGDLSEDEAFSWGLNRSKRSIALNLKSDAGREVFLRLVADADIVFDNFRPGVMERLGLDRDVLVAHNPQIITCSLTGFGGDGPWATMPAYDPIVQALSGAMDYTRIDEDGSPVRWGIPIGDLFAGIFAAIGVTGAVMHRDRTGAGQHVDISMLDVMLALNSYRVPQSLTFGDDPAPSPFEGGQGTVPFGNFECSDGWISLCWSQRMWPEACRIMNRLDLIDDERFRTNLDRHANADILIPILQEELKKRGAEDWQNEFMAAGVVAGKVTGVAEVFEHPQVLARGMAVEISDAFERTAVVAGDSLKFSDSSTWNAPSPIGSDTAIVLSSLLGMSDEELRQLDQAGTIYLGDSQNSEPLRPHERFDASRVEAPHEANERPLRGTTVLELNGDEPSKGFAAQMLADLGARVIRVDRPAVQELEPYPNEEREASFRAGLNRGKQNVMADLKSDEGQAFFTAMVKRADVVVDNYRPGVLQRLQIDNESLKKLNPGIISTSITGFGHSGPWSRYPAFDNAIQALGGGMSLTVDPLQPDVPVRWGNPIGGLTGAMFATLGTLAALRKRSFTGTGQALDVSLLDSQVALLSYRVPQAVTVGRPFPPEPRRGGSGSLPFGAFRTKDNRWFTVCITQQFWKQFCEAAGKPEWENDPRFATEPLRQVNEEALYALVEPNFLTKTGEEWQELYIEKRIPGALVLKISEAFKHPQTLARGMRVRLPDDEIDGGIEVANFAIKYSVSDTPPAALAPVPGRDTAVVAAEFGVELSESVNYSPAQRWGRLTDPSKQPSVTA